MEPILPLGALPARIPLTALRCSLRTDGENRRLTVESQEGPGACCTDTYAYDKDGLPQHALQVRTDCAQGGGGNAIYALVDGERRQAEE